jgi:ABC-type bacteriocin/lantibiotic exporter with double-glycine peptidase domain
MNILYTLIFKFFSEEIFRTFFIVFISCILNILKINILSYITANIIKSIQNKNIDFTYEYYKYFIIVSIIFIFLFNYYRILQTHLLSKLRQWVRYHIIKILLITNNEEYSNTNFTKLNTPIFRIANNCFYFFNSIMSSLIPNLTLLIIVCLYFLYNNLTFGFIFLFGNVIIISYIYFFWEQMMVYNNKFEEGVLLNESYIVELLNNFDKIIYRGESNNEIQNLWKKSENVINLGYNFYKNNTNHSLIINIGIFILIFILIYYLINLYINQNIDATIFITFLTILLLYRDIILTSVQQIPEYIEFIGRSAMINNTFKDINFNKIYSNDDEYIDHALEFNTIIFENISFKYKNQKKNILNNFNLYIETDNKIIGITGLSGIGKSTFVKLLIKMYKYDGDIYIDGININKLNTNYIRKNIIYVNQDSKLFDKKIIENIFFACDNKTDCNEYLKEIMKFKKIKDLFENLDFNGASVGKAGEGISGGQRQVINIINGLVSPSKIVILDEPTNALDGELKHEIIELIKYFKKYKKCIIIISHDKDIFPFFDQTIKMNQM